MLKGWTKEEKDSFWQSKYNYYRKFNFYVVVLSCISSVSYWISDCQLFDRIAWKTLLPRCFILFLLVPFVLIYRKVTDYRIMVPYSYFMVHAIMWGTIWAIVYLPDRTHASEGFIIMHLMFFAVAFCAPWKYSTIAHCLIIGNILISNLFNHYENFDLMLSLGIPCVVSICALNVVMTNVYVDQFRTKQRLEETLTIDGLTKVYNRNIFEHLLVPGTKQFIPELGDEIGIIMIDIDLFKAVNDTFGHEAGDEILKQVANTIQNVLRRTDVVVRWGGEEFVVVLPRCPMEKALYIAEIIRKNVEETDYQICRVTISLGVVAYDGADYLTSIGEADKYLYQAKQAGRNCVRNQEI